VVDGKRRLTWLCGRCSPRGRSGKIRRLHTDLHRRRWKYRETRDIHLVSFIEPTRPEALRSQSLGRCRRNNSVTLPRPSQNYGIVSSRISRVSCRISPHLPVLLYPSSSPHDEAYSYTGQTDKLRHPLHFKVSPQVRSASSILKRTLGAKLAGIGCVARCLLCEDF
jgi:hypothetical protein